MKFNKLITFKIQQATPKYVKMFSSYLKEIVLTDQECCLDFILLLNFQMIHHHGKPPIGPGLRPRVESNNALMHKTGLFES